MVVARMTAHPLLPASRNRWIADGGKRRWTLACWRPRRSKANVDRMNLPPGKDTLDLFRVYLDQIGQHPLLTKEDEI
jgi:hypothetical protein